MLAKLLAGAGTLALAAFLIIMFGNARYHAGELAAQVAAQPAAIAAEQRVAKAERDGRASVIAAVGTWSAAAAQREPIVIRSLDTVKEYAQTPAGMAACLPLDRMLGIASTRAALFPSYPAPDPAAGAGPVQPDPAPADSAHQR